MRLLILASVAACLCGRAQKSAASTDGIWAEEPPPLAREGQAAIYDPVRDRMLVFGGDSFNDVWVLSLAGDTVWTHLTTTGTPPSGRAGHSMIYDPVRDRVVVFGGGPPFAYGGNDVWVLSLAGAAWTQLFPSGTPPSARRGHTAIYDPVRDRMVIFGGSGHVVTDSTSGVQDFNDVWALSLADAPAWTELTPAGIPPDPRHGHSAIYDPVRDRMVVFGGGYGIVIYGRNDTWALSLAHTPAWHELSPRGTLPVPRADHNAIYDPVRDQMVVFGGIHGNGDYLNPWTCCSDDPVLSLAGGSAWVEPTYGEIPVARHLSGAIHDPVRDRLVVFGGALYAGPNSTAVHEDFNDTWALPLADGSAWGQLAPGDAPPPARSGGSAIFDPQRGRMLVFGGSQFITSVTVLNDSWTRSLGDSPAWAPISPAGAPPTARDRHTAIYDPVGDRMLVFGGESNPYYGAVSALNDLWALSLAGSPAWAALAPAGTPPTPRLGHSAIYDPVRDRMIVFGGSGWPDPFNDVWALSLTGSPTWTQLTAAGTPPDPRLGHSAIYDPVRDRMIVFGGSGTTGDRNDVWALALAGTPAWTLLSPSGTPPSPRHQHGAIYDPVRDRLVVFGGYGPGEVLNDAWALSLSDSPAWTQLTPAGTPPSAGNPATAIYDMARDRMVVWGGDAAAWDLAWSVPVSVPPGAGAASLRLDPAYPNPSRGDVAIEFALPHASTTTLRIYDVSGRLARTLVDGPLPAGPRSVRWDRRLSTGALARPGLYFYEISAEGGSVAKRLVLTQ